MTRRPRLPRVPERVEQAHIVQLLRSLGAAVYVLGGHRRKGDYQGTMMTAGIGDLYAILRRPPLRPDVLHGCGLWIEVKAERGRLSDAQHNFRALCLGAQVPHVVGGYDKVIAWLIAGGWLKPDAVPHYRANPERGAQV